MEVLKYKVIKTKAQYNQYCKQLESLLENAGSKAFQDEVDLLTVLIGKWDDEHNSFEEVDPIRLTATSFFNGGTQHQAKRFSAAFRC